jgi:hypothetical protein
MIFGIVITLGQLGCSAPKKSYTVANIQLTDNWDSSYFDTYLSASRDTSIYGHFRWGRSLSGVSYHFDSLNNYSKSIFCDICPEYTAKGTYQVEGQKIIVSQTEVQAEKDMDGNYSYLVSTSAIFDSSRTDTLYKIVVKGHLFLSYHKPSDSHISMWNLSLKSRSEYHKMDALPFRKLDF